MPKRRVGAKLREGRRKACESNEIWAMDFVLDQLATARRIRVLTIIDTFTRYSPAIDHRFSYKGQDVVETLERIYRRTGYPKTIRVDRGSEFISPDLDLLVYQKCVILTSHDPASRPTMRSLNRSTASSGQSS